MSARPHSASAASPAPAVREASRSGDRKTNLLIVASSLWIGGAETVIRHLAERIDRRRFNVTVCCLKQRGHIGDEMVRSGVDIVVVGDPSERVDYFTFRKLLRIIRERRIQVVHTHTTHGLVDATICKLLTRGLRVVHTFHFGNYPHTSARILWMERVFSRLADRLFAVGEVQRAQLKAVHRLRDRATRTIWNGVPLPASEGSASFRTRVGADGRILIGTIATLIEQKGLRDLLHVARRVRDEHGDAVRFVVVGEGKLRQPLEALRSVLGLDDTVVFTGWVTNAADVALPAFDIFFQPSLWEAMSVVVLEAMSHAVPIVATRVGENPHIIDDGAGGLLVGTKDVDGMAAALGRLIRDEALRRRLGGFARRQVEERFTVEHMTSAYEQVYLDLLR